jgi:hypothetical protein
MPDELNVLLPVDESDQPANDNEPGRIFPSPRGRRPGQLTLLQVLIGCWPRRMPAEVAALYCGEPNARAFLKRVGSEYPYPRVSEGRRRLWLRDDLDQAILPPELSTPRDLAEDL